MKVWHKNSCVVKSSVICSHNIFLSTSLKYFYLLLLDTLFFIFCLSRNFVLSNLLCLARRNHVLCIPFCKLKKNHVNIYYARYKIFLSLDTAYLKISISYVFFSKQITKYHINQRFYLIFKSEVFNTGTLTCSIYTNTSYAKIFNKNKNLFY